MIGESVKPRENDQFSSLFYILKTGTRIHFSLLCNCLFRFGFPFYPQLQNLPSFLLSFFLPLDRFNLKELLCFPFYRKLFQHLAGTQSVPLHANRHLFRNFLSIFLIIFPKYFHQVPSQLKSSLDLACWVRWICSGPPLATRSRITSGSKGQSPVFFQYPSNIFSW